MNTIRLTEEQDSGGRVAVDDLCLEIGGDWLVRIAVGRESQVFVMVILGALKMWKLAQFSHTFAAQTLGDSLSE